MLDNIPSGLLEASAPFVFTLFTSSELLNEHNINQNITDIHKYCTIIGVLLLKHQLLAHCKVYCNVTGAYITIYKRVKGGKTNLQIILNKQFVS